jgi:hypothetical protein
MKTIFLAFILPVLCLFTLPAQSQSEPLDAYQILNRSIEAAGGKAYLQSIKTLYTDFATEMEGRPVNWVVKEMLPNKGAFQIVYNTRTVYQNRFNGTIGYEIVGGEKKPLEPAAFKDKAYKKNIFNELDYIDTSLYKLKLVGEENVGKEKSYKVKVMCVDGTIRYLYFNQSSFFLVKEEKVSSTSPDVLDIVLFSEFKKFGQLTFYTVMKMGSGGAYQTLKLEKLLVNESVKEQDFE